MPCRESTEDSFVTNILHQGIMGPRWTKLVSHLVQIWLDHSRIQFTSMSGNLYCLCQHKNLNHEQRLFTKILLSMLPFKVQKNRWQNLCLQSFKIKNVLSKLYLFRTQRLEGKQCWSRCGSSIWAASFATGTLFANLSYFIYGVFTLPIFYNLCIVNFSEQPVWIFYFVNFSMLLQLWNIQQKFVNFDNKYCICSNLPIFVWNKLYNWYCKYIHSHFSFDRTCTYSLEQ